MLYFVYFILLISGLGLIISGNQSLTQQVKTSLPPEDLENIYNELKTRKIIGQIILVKLSFILMFYLT